MDGATHLAKGASIKDRRSKIDFVEPSLDVHFAKVVVSYTPVLANVSLLGTKNCWVSLLGTHCFPSMSGVFNSIYLSHLINISF